MKRVLIFIIALLFIYTPIKVSAVVVSSSTLDKKAVVYVFIDNDSEDSEKEKAWLEEYIKENKDIKVEYINISNKSELTQKVKNALDIKDDKLPLTIIGTTYFVGYNDKTKENIKTAIEAYIEKEGHCDVVKNVQNNESIEECKKQNEGIYEPKKSSIGKIIIIALLIICTTSLIIIKIKKRHS